MEQSTRQKTTSHLALPLTLTRTGQKPLHRQLYEQMREAILGGTLVPGTRLPSSRVLAKELSISRHIAVTAYEDLLIEGYLTTRHGSGTYVSNDLPHVPGQNEKPHQNDRVGSRKTSPGSMMVRYRARTSRA
jgi:DNA-binding transcriptional regulator YhcF (GntR family)